ncbi:MAG: lipopolysaccharide A protein [Desulfovibrionales bacterium]|nr:lipopolysaccharide A protein [Desulfovibrionales bacterium]
MMHRKLYKIKVYVGGYYDLIRSSILGNRELEACRHFFKSLAPDIQEEVKARVSYYNRLTNPFSSSGLPFETGCFKKGKSTSYHIDFKPLINCFPPGLRFAVLFGDICYVPEQPSFIKSRPVSQDPDNANSVLLKLNRARHYYIFPDKVPFRDKRKTAVWRGSSHKAKRLDFVKALYDKPWCDVGDVHKKSLGKPYHKEFMSVPRQLEHKYVLSVEGNDVASNLKWIMASNSLCMMCRPEYETWFMEGLLIPGVHYVELEADYSDLREKISYYDRYPEKAEQIISQAKAHSARFSNKALERLISLLVMQKYFDLST